MDTEIEGRFGILEPIRWPFDRFVILWPIRWLFRYSWSDLVFLRTDRNCRKIHGHRAYLPVGVASCGVEAAHEIRGAGAAHPRYLLYI